MICSTLEVLTLTTAGLGDFVPTSDGAKVMCSVFIYFGVACIGLLLGSYIAGMLDENASRAAKANRIKSCPNCTRIENIKDAAERRRSSKSVRAQKVSSGQFCSSMRADEVAKSLYEPNSKKMRVSQNSGYLGFSERMPPPTFEPHEISPSGRSYSSEGPPANITMSPNAFTFPANSHQTNFVVGSPMTSQIMQRQSHTRHASFDLNAGANFNATFGKHTKTDRRKYSADLPATIEESNAPPERHALPPAPDLSNETNQQQKDYETGDDDSYSSDFSSSTDSEDTVDVLESQYSGVKNAKYVFLTLREALLNSLVIIAFGCMGFYFIEGFSLIDSEFSSFLWSTEESMSALTCVLCSFAMTGWYFTTVLLTTGMI